MKKVMALLLAALTVMGLCACGGERQMSRGAAEYITDYVLQEVGDEIRGKPEIAVESVVELEEDHWAVLGTITVVTKEEGAELSGPFAVQAALGEDGKYVYSQEVVHQLWEPS